MQTQLTLGQLEEAQLATSAWSNVRMISTMLRSVWAPSSGVAITWIDSVEDFIRFGACRQTHDW